MIISEIASQILKRELAEFRGCSYALLDYPNYLNPGDSAIWIGTRAILENILGSAPSYVSTSKQFNAKACRAAISGGPVFFLGGGNFGSLYGKHNARRLKALKEIPGNAAIFLPFSIADSPSGGSGVLAEIIEALSGHRKLRLFSRERKTCLDLRDRFGFNSVLCPDLSHFLSPLVEEKRRELLFLMRKDGERLIDWHPRDATDWRELPKMKRLNRIKRLAALCPPGHVRLQIYDVLATRKARIAMTAIGESRHVATDRLHGMILASMMGVPTEAYDNMTGKVSSYFDTWSEGLHGVSFMNVRLGLSLELPG